MHLEASGYLPKHVCERCCINLEFILKDLHQGCPLLLVKRSCTFMQGMAKASSGGDIQKKGSAFSSPYRLRSASH